ncbi:MAG: thiamine diphosphokinase [Acidimicrobiia bacterium]
MAVPTAVVLAGGDPASPTLRSFLPEPSVVVAADSGLANAGPLGLTVDVLVGDLDSADPAAVARAERSGTTTVRHPVDKDHTDLELALLEASARGARRVVVVGGAGGRLDHLLANALVLSAPAFAHLAIEAYVGDARLAVARPGFPVDLTGAVGDLCSLLAVGGPARGVRTIGLRFALDGAVLEPGSTRGISNELAAPRASVSLERGTVLAVQPEFGRSR